MGGVVINAISPFYSVFRWRLLMLLFPPFRCVIGSKDYSEPSLFWTICPFPNRALNVFYYVPSIASLLSSFVTEWSFEWSPMSQRRATVNSPNAARGVPSKNSGGGGGVAPLQFMKSAYFVVVVSLSIIVSCFFPSPIIKTIGEMFAVSRWVFWFWYSSPDMRSDSMPKTIWRTRA